MNPISLVTCAAVFVSITSVLKAADAPGAIPPRDTDWPAITQTQKPWTRWWWLGSAVDKPNLTRELESFRDAGFGGVEVTPIYGAVGFENRYIDFLSPKFMELLQHTGEEGKRLDLGVDMATGTGWPFGGPWITPADADATVARDGDKFISKPTRMKVKRSAPGDEGLVANPYSEQAIETYLAPFTKAFDGFPVGLVGTQFHDSFEYSGNWSDALPAKFKQMHGYELTDHIDEFFGKGEPDTIARVKSDYRETLAALHMEYGEGWVKWSHDHGFKTREQAHGAPANLLDLYAAADIPETETFGFTAFPIPGFRADANGAHAQPQPMISRFASSAGHVAGRPLISSETFTWLREHFQVALSQCKPVADQIFLTGINHIFFHGSCYSPQDVAWPGWLFYASTEFNSRNTIWHDLPAMNAYIARCQSILQRGSPDNDVLLYWPIYDLWNDPTGMEKRCAMSPAKWANDSAAGKTAQELIDHGYCFDFVSDAQLAATKVADGKLQTSGGSQYQVLLVPPCDRMPVETLKQILDLAEAGATVVFQSHLPTDVPGLGDLENRRAKFKAEQSRLQFGAMGIGGQAAKVGQGRVIINDSPNTAMIAAHARREMIADSGVGFIRRRTDMGHDYFFSNLTAKASEGWFKLGSSCKSAVILDPLTTRAGVAATRTAADETEVYLQLRAGESLLLRCFASRQAAGDAWAYLAPTGAPLPVTGQWQVDFVEGGPVMPASFKTDKLASWTTLGDDNAKKFAGTARYRIEFDLPADATADDWRLDLGDLREVARLRVNGQDAGTIWCLPFTANIGSLLKPGGRNVLELDVTNLAANRIRDLDKSGAKWKAFHEINYVDIRYKPFDASKWELADSGLLGPVTLTPLRRQSPK